MGQLCLTKLKTKSLISKPLKTMKKLLYIFLFAAASAVSITSCTEEEVKPNTELDNGGGNELEKVVK